MEADAYKLGNLDATIDFGVPKEAFVKAILPAMGAAAGALMAPEGEGMQGAALGGLGALGLQSAAFAGARGLKGAFTPKPNPHAATPGGSQMMATAKVPEHLADLHKWNKQENAYAGAQNLIRRETASTDAELAKLKMAVDVSGSFGIPGLGVGFGIKDQRERLPGMSRWVPRSTVERGFDHADSGTSPEDVAAQESERGTIAHPLLGAALAAAGARKLMPNSGALGPLLAGLGGAGLGTLYNQVTKDRRVEEGLEAHSGAVRERSKFPINKHPTQTANESTPLAVSRGTGE